MGTTFVVVATDFMQASRNRNLTTLDSITGVGERIGDRFVSQALFDLLRGPDLDNVDSPLRGHSILGDMYGYGMVSYVRSIETIDAINGGTDQQFLRLQLMGTNNNIDIQTTQIERSNLNVNSVGNSLLTGLPVTFNDLGDAPGRFNGQLLTFVSGPLNGVSARILDHQVFPGSEHRFVIVLLNEPETFRVSSLLNEPETFLVSSSGNLVDEFDNTAAPVVPTRVVINGRPFVGTGAGRFDPASGGSASLSGEATCPHRRNESRNDLFSFTPDGTGSGTGTGGYCSFGNGTSVSNPNSMAINEPYDAPDIQNMFLAGFDDSGNFIPSFHRTSLEAINTPAQLGEYSFRPELNITANGDFPNINVTTATPFADRRLDVDHDNDGVTDGIWMDINLPVFTSESGQRIKPLVSYLVTDLDGKINVNVHGNRSHIASNGNFSAGASQTLFHSPTQPQGAINPLRGGGYGPAEVNLNRVFEPAEAERLMIGVFDNPDPNAIGTVTIPGRFGHDPVPLGMGRRRNAGGGPVPGQPASIASPGADPFALYKLFNYPLSANAPMNPGVLGRAFLSSPMDVFGRFRTDFPQIYDSNVGTFPIGLPAIDVGASTLVFSELYNSPYEVDFSPPGQQLGSRFDQLFTLKELEFVYRRGAPDLAGQDGRLFALAENTFRANSAIATTESWEVPTSYGEFLTATGNLNDVAFETLATKLYSILQMNGPSLGIPFSPTKEQEIMAHISGFFPQAGANFNYLADNGGGTNGTSRGFLSVDVREGRPFNINQPFGDGLEIDGELPHPDGSTRQFDYDNDSFDDPAGSVLDAKRQFARQLFVLTLLTTEVFDRNGNGSIFSGTNQLDPGDFYDFDGDNDVDDDDRFAYREVIAQWVANVIEFRDPDSIMTSFEFDLNPFNGWQVDGDILTPDNFVGNNPGGRHVVWGMERPELLITESLALHDRRTEDRMDDDGDGQTTDNGDDHFDSRLVPDASVFFELYHPWEGTNQQLPPELENEQADLSAVRGVDLTAQAPNGAPVWRMMVFSSNVGIPNSVETQTANPFDPSEVVNGAALRRVIYFNQPPNSANALFEGEFEGNNIYFADPTVTAAGYDSVITPGDYAIIGSRGEDIGGVFTTYLGRQQSHMENTAVNTAVTRRIELDTNTREIVVHPSGMPEERFSATVLPMVGPFNPDNGVVADRSLGLTDPILGYPPSIPDPDGEGRVFVDPMDGTTEIILDEPADFSNALYEEILSEDGLLSGAYFVRLQRLADPTSPWNFTTNPYLDVDSAGCDLFTFNGIDNSATAGGSPIHSDFFSSFERRERAQTGDMQDEFGQDVASGRFRMLWKTEFAGQQPGAMTTSPSDGTHNLNRELQHSFGRLNRAYETAMPTASPTTEVPFAWLTWNNRPFASAYELAYVPFTSSFAFPIRFDISQSSSLDGFNPFAPVANADIRSLDYSGDFPHLLNFTANQPNRPALYRLFDFLEVPSRYVGTERYVNPADYYAATANSPVSISRGFAPPYDTISNYRVPGKMNINTIYDQDTWNALVGIDPNVAASSNGRVSYNTWQTERGRRVFSPVSSAFNVAGVAVIDPIDPTDTSLFREAMAGVNDPLFDYDPTAYTQDALNSANRNAFFKFHERQRIANSVTSRSSMFAISIIIGYFNVDQNGSGDVLGAEALNENSLTTRNRGFFIVDRSIPVAFEPGKDHNVDRAIRVSSFIE